MSKRMIRFRALVRKELLATLKEKTSRMILVAPLVLYIILFGYIASFNLNHIPYALCDLSGSEASAQFVRAVDNNKIFERVATVQSVSQIKALMDEGETLLTVVIEPQFAQHLKEGKSAQVQVVIDGRNSTTAQLAAGYLTQIAQTMNATLTGVPELIKTRFLFNPNVITQWFIMPGMIVMLSMLQVVVLSALSVAREREQGTFEQLLVSPYTTAELLASKSIVPILIGLFQSTLIFLVDLFWFEIPMGGSVLAMYFVLLLFILSVVGLGLAVSAYSQTMQQGLLIVFVFLVPMVLLSGLFAPVANMPQWIQLLTYADPLRFTLSAVRRIYLAGAPLSAVLVSMWPVVVMAAVTLPAAYYFFKKRL